MRPVTTTTAIAAAMHRSGGELELPEEIGYDISAEATAAAVAEDAECFESALFIKFQYTIDDLLLAASTGSTVFNFLVIFCAFKLFKRSGDTMHLFILNMTLGDLLLTVFCHPNEFLVRKHEFLRSVHLCAVLHFCNWLGWAVSGLSLTLLNLDKLIYFRFPLNYDQTMSKRRAAILCFCIWGVSLLFVGYVWFFEIVYATADCMLHMADHQNYYYEIFMVAFCVLPVTSSLVVSAYLFGLIRQKRHAPAVAPVPSSDGGTHVDMPTFKNKAKSLVFIFATTVWTSFSLLPYRLFNICRIHLVDWNTLDCDQQIQINWLAWILIYLLTLNPIVNPFITAIIYAPYRRTLKKLLIKIPIGNRLHHYTYNRTTSGVLAAGGDAIATETSYFSTRRHHHSHPRNRPAPRKGSGSTDQELRPLSEQLQRQSVNSSEAAGSSSIGSGAAVRDSDLSLGGGGQAKGEKKVMDDSPHSSSTKSSSQKSEIKQYIDDDVVVVGEESKQPVRRSIAFRDDGGGGEVIETSLGTTPAAANGK